MTSLTFAGGAGSVTGSKFLLEHDTGDERSQVLVDCGLYQGRKAHRLLNWADPPFAVSDLNAIVVTHAHIDHVGAVPRLVRTDFGGTVHVTHDTLALSRIVLPDSGHIHEEEAAYANRRGYSKHHPALPLYTEMDARRALESFVGEDFEQPAPVAPGMTATFHRAGHILGAASVSIDFDNGKRVTFSGDLGTADHPLLAAPEPLGACDVLVCESTYGDRDRPDEDVAQRLADAVNDTARQGGVVVIPAFSVDRTEIVLWHLAELRRKDLIPDLPVYLDSPMASAALEVYRKAAARPAADLRPEVANGSTLFEGLRIRETRTVEESMQINEARGPMVIISASGMATGGRVLHHLAHRLGDSRNTVVLVGFQAPGTRGRSLLDGATDLKFFGRYHPVRARVVDISLSAHAGRDELLDWIESAPTLPGIVYFVHGEPAASEAICAAAIDRGIHAVVPRLGERVLI